MLLAVDLQGRISVTLIHVLVFFLSVAVHEYGHAMVATWLGDPTPSRQGRTTLNPVVHADPIGTFLVPALGAIVGFPLLAWGKPVETVPHLMTRRWSMTVNSALVAIAGPLCNILLGLCAVAIAMVWHAVASRAAGGQRSPIVELLGYALIANIHLFVFNLLPIHPLDGGKVLAALLPKNYAHYDVTLQRVGPFLLLGVLIVGGFVLGPLFSLFDQVGLRFFERALSLVG